jgi:hypothetical protein
MRKLAVSSKELAQSSAVQLATVHCFAFLAYSHYSRFSDCKNGIELLRNKFTMKRLIAGSMV